MSSLATALITLMLSAALPATRCVTYAFGKTVMSTGAGLLTRGGLVTVVMVFATCVDDEDAV